MTDAVAELAVLAAALERVVDQLPMVERVLWRDVRRATIDYSDLRCRWALADGAARREIDPGRTRAHDAFIDALNALSRRCGVHGLDQGWRSKAGDPALPEGRRRLGDLACYLAFVTAVAAR